MKQVVLRAGAIQVVEVPAPSPAAGHVLAANLASVISSGTERAAAASGGGEAPLAVRAVRNPELVRRALEHMREHGLRETLDLARGATAPDSALGYSSAGVVLDTGGINAFSPGQLVACGGAGSANHADLVSVPGNLVVGAPQGLQARSAAFATLGAIALQGVRRTQPTLGERVVVVGLGLLGLLILQLLRAAGCSVLGVEPVETRRQLASKLGAEVVAAPDRALDSVRSWTSDAGSDAVVIAASGSSSAIVNDAVAMLRPKGRVVPVGDVGLALERGPLYRREADVLISTSYGPGRYDPTYELAGVDYPLGYVRWTENRNMSAFLDLVSDGRVDVESMIGLELPAERAGEAYAAISGADPPLAAVLTYRAPDGLSTDREVVRVGRPAPATTPNGTVRVAIIGAGGFVSAVHIPNLKADGRARVTLVVNRTGTSASDAARLVGGADTATDWRAALDRDDVDLILVGTRHDSHAEITSAALAAGRAVFVEKPLGLSREQIDSVWEAGRASEKLAIGFNRPFATLARTLERELRSDVRAPVHLIYRVSAPLPADHWLNDPATGGGRLLGEACHMFDFANWLCGTPERVWAAALPGRHAVNPPESSSVTIDYADGSLATVHYSAAGAHSMPKERVEVMSGGRSWVLDDFRSLTSFTSEGKRVHENRDGDKGHSALMSAVLDASLGLRPFEPGLGAAYAAQSVALAAVESIASGGVIVVSLPQASP